MLKAPHVSHFVAYSKQKLDSADFQKHELNVQGKSFDPIEISSVHKIHKKLQSSTIYQKYYRQNGQGKQVTHYDQQSDRRKVVQELNEVSLTSDGLGLGIKLPKHLLQVNRLKSSVGSARNQLFFHSNTSIPTSREKLPKMAYETLQNQQRLFQVRLRSGINRGVNEWLKSPRKPMALTASSHPMSTQARVPHFNRSQNNFLISTKDVIKDFTNLHNSPSAKSPTDKKHRNLLSK